MRKRLKQNYKGAEYRNYKGHEQRYRARSEGALPVTPAMAKLITVKTSADDEVEEESSAEDEIVEVGSSSKLAESKAASSAVTLPRPAQTQDSNQPAAAPSPAPARSPEPSPEPAAHSAGDSKEVLILEMPGVMIQPLKLQGGMFQVR